MLLEDHNSGQLLYPLLLSSGVRERERELAVLFSWKDVLVSYNNCSPNLTKVTPDHSYRQR